MIRPTPRLTARLLIGVVFALLFTGTWITLLKPKPTSSAPTHVVTVSTQHPSEADINQSTYQSTATGDQPKYIRLPSIGAGGYIQAVGMDQNNQVAVPTNIHLAGWFVKTVTPGDLGLSIIDGHLDGYRRPGIFDDLGGLKPGDKFEVDLANGATRVFSVVTVQKVPLAQAATALFNQSAGISHELNLITCGGSFTAAVGYDMRVIVIAKLIT